MNTRDFGFINFNGQEMQFVNFNGTIVYEAWKKLMLSKIPPLTLSKCKGVPLLDYKIYGNSIQNGTLTPDTPIEVESVGKKTRNLINPVRSIMQNGITITRNNDGTFTVNGTSTANQDIRLINKSETDVHVKVYKGKYYKLSRTEYTNTYTTAPMIHATLYIGDTQTWAWISVLKSGKAKTPDADGEVKELIFYCEKGAIFDNYIFGLKLEEVEDENSNATEYEPYGYKIPVKVSGKNLMPPTFNNISSKYVTIDEDGWINVDCDNTNGTDTIYLNFWPDKNEELLNEETYTFVLETQEVENITTMIISQERTDNIAQFNTTLTAENITANAIQFITATCNNATDGNYLNRAFFSVGIGVHRKIKFRLSLLQGKITEENYNGFEEYVEQITTNVYLNEPLRKIGDYADYIDFKNSKVVRNVNVINLNGNANEIWNTWGVSYQKEGVTGFYIYLYKHGFASATLNTRNCLCNIVPYGDNVWGGINVGCGISPQGTQYITLSVENKYLSDTSSSEQAIVSFKELLSSLNVKFYYILATPIEETIELPTVPTLKGTTVLEIDTKIQPSNLEVIYKGKK